MRVPAPRTATRRRFPVPCCPLAQVIEELFTYWNLEDADETLEELEDALIVSRQLLGRVGVPASWRRSAGQAQVLLRFWSAASKQWRHTGTGKYKIHHKLPHPPSTCAHR